MSSVAKLVNVTISPTVIAPRTRRYAPTKKTQSTVSVDDARVATETTAHHERIGICASSKPRHGALKAAHLALDAREALDDRQVAERVGRSLGELGAEPLDLPLEPLGLADDERRQHAEGRHEAHEQEPHAQVEKEREAAGARRP